MTFSQEDDFPTLSAVPQSRSQKRAIASQSQRPSSGFTKSSSSTARPASSTASTFYDFIPQVQQKRFTSDATPPPPPKRRSIDAPYVLSVDIDGTIADIAARINMSKSYYQEGSNQYWDMLLDGQYYYMDTPIIPAREWLKKWITGGNQKREIFYVSGRRQGTEEQTKTWLKKYDFPDGQIIHRRKKVQSGPFKARELSNLSRKYNVVAHLGDRDDDGWAANEAGVRFIRCTDGYWLTLKQVQEQKLDDLVDVVWNEKEKDGVRILLPPSQFQ